jgi:hypothetical protein
MIGRIFIGQETNSGTSGINPEDSMELDKTVEFIITFFKPKPPNKLNIIKTPKEKIIYVSSRNVLLS